MTPVEMIAVIEHYRNGGLIESRPRHCGGGWSPVSIPIWNFNRFEYRPKKEPAVVWGVFWYDGEVSPCFFEEREKAEDVANLAAKHYAGVMGACRVVKMVEVEG